MTNDLEVIFPNRREKLTKHISLRLTHDEHARYVQMAEEMGISLNAIIRSLLEAQYKTHTIKEQNNG